MSPSVADVDERLNRHELATEKKFDSFWEALNGIKDKLDRLPFWGVMLISTLTFLLGVSVTVAVTAIRIAST